MWLATAVGGVGISLWSLHSCHLQLLLLWVYFGERKGEVVSLRVPEELADVP